MEKVSIKHLESKIDSLNKSFRDNYQLDGAYGGYKITLKTNNRDVLSSGFVSKAKLYDLLCAYMAGIRAAGKL